MTVRTPCAMSSERPRSLSRQSWSERMRARRRTRRPSAAASPPRSRALRHASHASARVASLALSPNDAADVGDAHDDEQSEQEHEADGVDGSLDLRREALAEDPADQDEEEASAIETRG